MLSLPLTITIRSTMFSNTQGVTIGGNATLSAVHRDQYNRTTINQTVHMGVPGRTIMNRANDGDFEYNEYREIIRGDIHKLEQLFSGDVRDGERKDDKIVSTSHSCRRTIHRARVHGDNRVFTACSYHGRDAEKIWKKDFMKYSQANDPAVLLQLFGINQSRVPTLLFYDEWLPLGYLYEKMKKTFWENFYLTVYTEAWERKMRPGHTRIFSDNLWLNSRTGHVSSGPRGPLSQSRGTKILYNCEDMPSAMEMANANTCVRFFSQTGAGNLDLNVVRYAYGRCASMTIEDLLGIRSVDRHNHRSHNCWMKYSSRPWQCDTSWHLPRHIAYDELRDFIGKLQWDTVYSGVQLEKVAFVKQGLAHSWEIHSDSLRDKMLIDSGLTRFQFNADLLQDYLYIYFDTTVLREAWLSQAHRFINSEICFIPHLSYVGHIEPRHRGYNISAPELPPFEIPTLPAIIYLFLRPPPPSLADIDSWFSGQMSFWSLDENGMSEIPEFECKRMGLPSVVLDSVKLRLQKYSKHVYDAIYAWQVARGFDPTTADFARSLGLPALELGVTQFMEGPSPISSPLMTRSNPPKPNIDLANFSNPPSHQSSPSPPPPPPPVTRVSQRKTPQKRKQVKVVVIHDTDSESEPDPDQPKQKQIRMKMG